MNKVLITVYVPLLDEKFDLFIPINKKIGTIKNILINSILELSNNSVSDVSNLKLYEKNTCKLLENNVYVNSSGIINGSYLILL